MSIYVTKPFLPPKDDYTAIISQIFERRILTNQGPCVRELEAKLSEFLGLRNFQYVTNGTIALQLALKALGITGGEVITTPFTYVATISSILWERCTPVFVDIEPDNFTINADKIEEAVTGNTVAIMPVHVFGYACNVGKIQEIAERHNLKVIYDAAHAFASRYNGRSLLDYGDISTCSFHATKLYHTVEGGGVAVRDDDVAKKLELVKRFGHNLDEHICLGINGKQSEFHAAMGLAILPYLNRIIAERKRVSDLYDRLLSGRVQRPRKQDGLDYNYAYYPVVFRSESELLRVFDRLHSEDIFPRRYFYPSLNNLPYLHNAAHCPVSEDISCRIACLPLYPDLKDEEVTKIAQIIGDSL